MAAQPLVPPDFRGREQTWRAYKRLLQFMHGRSMKPGDKMPAQAELRRLLGLNNSTLSGAMRRLVSQGVVSRKRRVGTVVANIADAPAVAWSVGVATFPAPAHGPDSFFAELAIRIQTALARARCRCISYMLFRRMSPHPFTEFFGLAEDIADSNLDGLICLTPLRLSDWRSAVRRGIAICHTPHWEEATCGVLIDQGSLVEQAIPQLMARGCKSIALVTFGRADVTSPRAFHAFRRAAAAAGIPESRAQLITATDWSSEGGRLLATELRSRPEKQRPQGLIVLDDYTALGLTQALQVSGDYHPRIALQANHQLPLIFPRPVLRFETDVEELATHSVDMLLRRMQNPTRPEQVEWLPTRLAEADAAVAIVQPEAPRGPRRAGKPERRRKAR
ncbi:MAG: substrate-binding domain-containing protein [Planctomycetota bacterium]|nr:substrate-binding domain-containing protein [Planctomycetota bacterium]